MRDYVIRGASKNGELRFFCAITTGLVEKARKVHDCSPISIAALGRLLTGGTMMGMMLKSMNDKLTLQINGKGPSGSIVVVADSGGNVKGYISNPHVDLLIKDSGKLDVAKAVGINGVLTVIKDFGLKEPYMGQIPIQSGEIAEDLTAYFAISEQIPTAVALGVFVEPEGYVSAAGGFIVQVMPDASDESISTIENNIKDIESITKLIIMCNGPEDIIEKVFGRIEVEIYEDLEIDYICDCSEDKIDKVLISLGKEELESMIEEQGQAEITCHFCNKRYCFTKEQLQDILEKAL